MSPLSPEEQAALEELEKESASLLKELPKANPTRPLPGKFSDFAPGMDDQGRLFPK